MAISLAFGSLLLAACGTVHNRDTEYTQATSVPELKIPANVPAEKFSNSYPIPPITGDKPVTPADLVPPGLTEAEDKAEKDAINDKNNEVTK